MASYRELSGVDIIPVGDDLLERQICPCLPFAAHREILHGVRSQLHRADESIAALREKLCEADGLVAAYDDELKSARVALVQADDTYAVCYRRLMEEYEQHVHTSQRFQLVCEQNAQIAEKLHELANENVRLRQVLDQSQDNALAESRQTESGTIANMKEGDTRMSDPEHREKEPSLLGTKPQGTGKSFGWGLLPFRAGPGAGVGEHPFEHNSCNDTGGSARKDQTGSFQGSHGEERGDVGSNAPRSRRLRPKNPDMRVLCL